MHLLSLSVYFFYEMFEVRETFVFLRFLQKLYLKNKKTNYLTCGRMKLTMRSRTPKQFYSNLYVRCFKFILKCELNMQIIYKLK